MFLKISYKMMAKAYYARNEQTEPDVRCHPHRRNNLEHKKFLLNFVGGRREAENNVGCSRQEIDQLGYFFNFGSGLHFC